MKNPYDVLGVPEGASLDQVKMAYKILSGKYQNDVRKMDELNAAYDSIVMGQGGSYRNAESDFRAANDYSDISAKIRSGRLDDAQILLDGIPEQNREAQWYYLKGTKKRLARRSGKPLCNRPQHGPLKQHLQNGL